MIKLKSEFKVDKYNIDQVINGIQGLGVYCFRNDKNYLYIGKSINFRNRMFQHRKWINLLINDYGMSEIELYYCEDIEQMDTLEMDAIDFHKPYFNIQFKGSDYVEMKVKVPPFIALKMKEMALRSPENNLSIFAIEGFEYVLNKHAEDLKLTA